MRVAPRIVLNEGERKTLTKWARGRRTPVRLVERAKIVLAAAAGQRNEDIAIDLGIPRKRVGRWRSRFGAEGLEGIEKDRPRGGRKASARESIEPEVIKKTTQERPANATHWSTRTLAKELCCTQSMVHRIWKSNGLKPHLVRTFKISNDPRFEEKLGSPSAFVGEFEGDQAGMRVLPWEKRSPGRFGGERRCCAQIGGLA